jgi:DNA-binding response OmpR family regulator
MSSPLEKVHAFDKPPEVITVLVVTADPGEYAALASILNRPNWAVSFCRRCSDAFDQFRNLTPAIVLCERALPDGNWRSLLSETQIIDRAPLLLVASRHADERLWAEVLSAGGYDVLQKPFDPAEVSRVLSAAGKFWSAPRRHGGRIAEGLSAPWPESRQ